MDCLSCQAEIGKVELTIGPRIDLDDHWRLEHCHPVATPGWLVLVVRRHARALHDLDSAEAEALGRWLTAVPRALHAATGCELEYVMQFAEGEGFHHVHFHLVARPPGLREDWRGPRIWQACGAEPQVTPAEATTVLDAVREHLQV